MNITDTYKNRKDITSLLSLSLQKHLNPHNDPRIYLAREVAFDYSTNNRIRVDFMRFKPLNNSVSDIEKGDFYCYEVKSSVEDFRSKNGHNFIGDYNYYVMPEEVYEVVKKKIPWNVGVFVPDGWHHNDNDEKDYCYLRSVSNARRKDRTRGVAEMLLMMFRSSARDSKYN